MFAALFAGLLIAAPPTPFQVDAPSLDAGEIKAGPALIRRYAFVNAGTEPLTVTDLKASCGCATPTLAQRTYQPGERGEISLEVNTLSQAVGPQRWTLAVGYRSGEHAGSTTLELTARLVREVEVTPAEIVFRGDGPLSTRVFIRDLRIHSASELPPSRSAPLGVRCTTSAPYLAVSDSGESNTFGSYSLALKVTAECPPGRHQETVTIYTDIPDCREIKLPVTIVREAKGRIMAAPTRATLVAGGSALVQLRDADNQPVKVEKVESHPALTYRWAPGPGSFATLRIGLDRAKWDGSDFSGQVHVSANGQTLAIPVDVRSRD